jgi:large subunit ribosomal protein L25
MRIVDGSKIILEIPVTFKNKNDSPGLKKGGVLNVVRRKVELKCIAEKIPENIEIDLAGLDIGASIKISSVKLPTDTRPTITDRDFVVATVAPPTIVKEPEKPTEEVPAEGEEAAVEAEGEATTAPTKEGEVAKKDDKGKEQSSDKKQAGDKKPAAEKKQEKK